MEKGDRQSGGPEQRADSREPQRAPRPAPGKVTPTSRVSPGGGPAVQRKAAVLAPAAPRAGSRGDHTADTWMDAAHRGVSALAETAPGGGAEMPVQRSSAPDSENPSTAGSKAEGKPEEAQEGEAFIKGAGDAGEISPNDVEQGQLGDCWLLAGLMAVAKTNPDAIRNMIKPAGAGKWTVTFHFPTSVLGVHTGYEKESVTVDARVPVVAAGGKPLFANVGDVAGGKKELWVLLVEKAYAKTRGKYADITGSNAPADHQSMEMITGKRDRTLAPTDQSEDELLATLQLALTQKQGVQLWTIKKDHDKAPLADSHTPRIVTNHGYVLDGVDKANRTVDILNPWGSEYTIRGLGIDKVRKFFREIRIGG